MMSVPLRLGFVACGLALSLASPSRAGTATLPGERTGPGIPQRYDIVSWDLRFDGDRALLTVYGEGDCHWEYRQRCYWAGNPPQQICYPEREWICYRTSTGYRLPASIRREDKKVLYVDGDTRVEIGRIKSFLFWKWVELNDRARVSASWNEAGLVVETGGGTLAADRTDRFDRIHDIEPMMALLVEFPSTVSTGDARQAIRDSGYAGELTLAGPDQNAIGLKTPLSRAATLIFALKADARVLKIVPAP